MPKISGFILITFTLIMHFPLAAQVDDANENRLEELLKRLTNWGWIWGTDQSDSYEGYDIKNLELKIGLNKDWRFSIGDNATWASPAYSDMKWEKIKVPAKWENEGFNGYDGYAWYRVHFDGRLLNTQEAYVLMPGFIDDVDETYLNGTVIGKSGTFPPRFRTAYLFNRSYYIPRELINFNGDNLIAIRVYDETLDGGIIAGNPGIYAHKQSDVLIQHFYGSWKFRISKTGDFSDPEYYDTNWENIIVPSFWDNQGYRSFDGIAWYRKSFQLDFVPDRNKKYYLVLGKIDDFDVTYLNGVKIGETNDGRRFGESESFNQIRIYPIPAGVLNARNKNVLSVKVTDIGKDGGIYTGPLGIVEQSSITKIIRNSY